MTSAIPARPERAADGEAGKGGARMARPKMLLAVLLGALALVGPVADDARAYQFYLTKDGSQPLRWWQRGTLSFTLGQTVPEETALANIQPLVEAAFDAWISTPCGLVPEVVYAGPSTATHATTPTN